MATREQMWERVKARAIRWGLHDRSEEWQLVFAVLEESDAALAEKDKEIAELESVIVAVTAPCDFKTDYSPENVSCEMCKMGRVLCEKWAEIHPRKGE